MPPCLIPTLVLWMACIFSSLKHHYQVLAFSKDLSSWGLWWKSERRSNLQTTMGKTEHSHPSPQSLKQYLWMVYIWKQTSVHTTQIYHAPALGRPSTSPSCSLKQNLLAATVVAMKYGHTGVIFLILGNQSLGETNEFIPSLPIQRVNNCKAAGFSLLAQICTLLSTKVKVATSWEYAFTLWEGSKGTFNHKIALLGLVEIFCKRRQVDTCQAPRLLKWLGEQIKFNLSCGQCEFSQIYNSICLLPSTNSMWSVCI